MLIKKKKIIEICSKRCIGDLTKVNINFLGNYHYPDFLGKPLEFCIPLVFIQIYIYTFGSLKIILTFFFVVKNQYR